jgi:hypothetical protein
MILMQFMSSPLLKVSIIFFLTIFFILPVHANESVHVLNSDNMLVWSADQNFNQKAEWKIHKGTLIKYVSPTNQTPSFAQAFKILDAKGRESKQTYYISRKILEENTASVMPADINTVIQQTNPTTNCPPTAKSQTIPTGRPTKSFSDDPNYNFAAAEDFAIKTPLISPDNFEIKSRSSWGAEAPQGQLEAMKDPTAIIIHHTTNPITGSIKSIQDDHFARPDMDNKDIGYHYIIRWNDKSEQWETVEGRAKLNGKLTKGSHAAKDNTGKIGIAIMGNFQPYDKKNNPFGYNKNLPENQKQMSKEASIQLGSLIQKLKSEYPTIKDVESHGSNTKDHMKHAHYGIERSPHSAKDCPGEGVIHIAAAYRYRFFPDKGGKIR